MPNVLFETTKKELSGIRIQLQNQPGENQIKDAFCTSLEIKVNITLHKKVKYSDFTEFTSRLQMFHPLLMAIKSTVLQITRLSLLLMMPMAIKFLVIINL